MPRPKVSCDWEVPNCTRLARHIIVAERKSDKHRNRSQYCDDHAEIAPTIVPQGWAIVSNEPIGGNDDC